MKVLILCSVFFLSSCTFVGPALKKAEKASDAVLMTAHKTICDKHLPLRAYQDMYGHMWQKLIDFCAWGNVPPEGLL